MASPCGFESHLSHQKLGCPLRDGPIFIAQLGLEESNAARVSAAGEGWTEPNINSCPKGRNANESHLSHNKNQIELVAIE